MKIVELHTTDGHRYKEFFTQGLIKHNDCFRISINDEKKEDFPTKSKADSFTLACITDENELAGVVSFEREGATREKLRHKGLLFRMYVSDKWKGQGIGKQLVKETISRAKAIGNIEQINLTVISTNTPAKKLYEQFGFTPFSIEKMPRKTVKYIIQKKQWYCF